MNLEKSPKQPTKLNFKFKFAISAHISRNVSLPPASFTPQETTTPLPYPNTAPRKTEVFHGEGAGLVAVLCQRDAGFKKKCLKIPLTHVPPQKRQLWKKAFWKTPTQKKRICFALCLHMFQHFWLFVVGVPLNQPMVHMQFKGMCFFQICFNIHKVNTSVEASDISFRRIFFRPLPKVAFKNCMGFTC